MRRRKEMLLTVVISVTLITAGLILGCGDDDKSYNPVGSYSISYNYISGDCPFDNISSELTINNDWQIIAEELRVEIMEFYYEVGTFIAGTIIDCDAEGCQFEINAVFEAFEINAVFEAEEPFIFSFELAGSGNISSSGEMEGSLAIEIPQLTCTNNYSVVGKKN